jgi:uncharacterized damage-inducible protein DinB
VLESLHRLFAHMRWADERALEALRGADPVPQRALETFAHVLGAEHVWLARLQQRPASVAVWPVLDLDACERLARENAAEFDDLLDGLAPEDLQRTVSYQNSAGQSFDTRREDILLHVAMHGSYHRGQVATLLRQEGAVPEPTDYIAFVRGAPAATHRP